MTKELTERIREISERKDLPPVVSLDKQRVLRLCRATYMLIQESTIDPQEKGELLVIVNKVVLDVFGVEDDGKILFTT